MMCSMTHASRSVRGSASLSLVFSFLLFSPTLRAQAAPAQQPAPKPVRVRTQMDGFDLSSKSGKAANQIGGASRDLGTPKLYAPGLGKAYTTTPVFHWAAAEVGAKVTFRLMGENGQVVYELPTTEDHLRYPGDAPALTAGSTYKWTIVPENDVLGGPPPPASVLIVTGTEREAIQTELKSANDSTAAAQVFVKHRIWYDAVQEYTDLIERLPNDNGAREARSELYDQLPVTKALADADWRMVH